ncbi:MAG: M48 family metalloprotease [Firmicutes bacterium]|jgi:hypothetical protein|nr:M48 family metalloprotease [Bacillota bacterium]
MVRRGLFQRLCVLLSVLACVLALTGCSPEENLVSLMGTVVDPDGKPVPGVAVLIGSSAAITDSQGRFHMDGVFADSEAAYVLEVGRAPTRIPLALGDGAQTISLIYRPTEWMEKTPTIDFLLVFDAETDLKSDRGFSYAYARSMQREIQRTTGLGNLEAAIPYLGAEALVCVGRSLGVRNIVWVSKHLDRYLQVFNVQDRTTVVLPFSRDGDVWRLQSPLGTYADRGPAGTAEAPVKGTEAHLARQVLPFVEGRYRVVYSGPDVERLKRVARSLVPVTERSNVDFTFGVLEAREYNAFALPGGYVYITRPLLEMLDADTELAAVLAHEMVHICHLHAVRNYERQIGLTVTAIVVGAVTGKMQSAANMLDLLGQILDVGYSYSQEYDADSTGMVYLMKAGYPMEGMLSLLNKLSSLERALGDNTRGFSRTHPPTESRIRSVRQTKQELAFYEIVNTYLRWRMKP